MSDYTQAEKEAQRELIKAFNEYADHVLGFDELLYGNGKGKPLGFIRAEKELTKFRQELEPVYAADMQKYARVVFESENDYRPGAVILNGSEEWHVERCFFDPTKALYLVTCKVES